VAGAGGFGVLLREHRVRGSLSQDRLAEGSGLSTRTVRRYEAGRVRRPRGESVRLLADALGLAGGERARFEAAARAPGPAGPGGEPGPGAGLGAAGGGPVAAGPGGGVVCQLPPDAADFVGRAGVVARVRRLLVAGPGGGAGAVRVVAVAGGAGVGKTALAVHVGHRLAAQFPGGQLFVSLRGGCPGPPGPGEVLGWLLRALGADGGGLPPGVDQRAALYRSALAGRRVLVVLDDAAGEAQVRPLLPGSAGCAVLVTSRARLGGLEGAARVDLGPLGPAAARQLLGRIVGAGRVAAEPAAAAELARLCGYLPLAVRVAGARLAARPHWRLGQLVDRLADERGRLDQLAYRDLAVRPSLARSYQALDPAARALFGRLGLLGAPEVAAWVAAALLDLPAGPAGEAADRLVDAHLLEVAGRDGGGQVRYRLPGLAGLYARECAAAAGPPRARRAALARAVGGWLALAERADAALGTPLLEPVYGPAARWPAGPAATGAALAGPLAWLDADPLAWLDAERPALSAAVTQAAAAGLAGLACELTSALTQFLAARGHLDDWRRATAAALAAARRARDTRGQAAVLVSAGARHALGGRPGQAARCWQAALAIFGRLADPTGQAMCLAGLALCPPGHASYQQRRQQAEHALALLDHGGGSPRARACVLRCLSLLHHQHGRPGLAQASLQQALAVPPAPSSRPGQARQLPQPGAALLTLGHHPRRRRPAAPRPAGTARQRAPDYPGQARDRHGPRFSRPPAPLAGRPPGNAPRAGARAPRHTPPARPPAPATTPAGLRSGDGKHFQNRQRRSWNGPEAATCTWGRSACAGGRAHLQARAPPRQAPGHGTGHFPAICARQPAAPAGDRRGWVISAMSGSPGSGRGVAPRAISALAAAPISAVTGVQTGRAEVIADRGLGAHPAVAGDRPTAQTRPLLGLWRPRWPAGTDRRCCRRTPPPLPEPLGGGERPETGLACLAAGRWRARK
jgi:hypothetical protein